MRCVPCCDVVVVVVVELGRFKLFGLLVSYDDGLVKEEGLSSEKVSEAWCARHKQSLISVVVNSNDCG
jgi:predicted HAD superfamily phosphohydrolase YqeG